MSFFEPPRPPRREAPVDYRQPDWLGPPENVVGQPVAMRPLLFRTDRAAVVVTDFVAYPTGVEFRVDVRGRPGEPERWPFDWGGPPWHHDGDPGDELPDDLLRVGVLLPDGRKATTLEQGVPDGVDEPRSPRLVGRGGGGGGRRWEQSLWLWPLPAAGPMLLVVEWPAVGLHETRAEIDGRTFRNAAQSAVELWPDDRPEPPPLGHAIWSC